MDHVRLGRTGLSVSVAGLGCGGHSRLGQSQGATFDDSVQLVQAALDIGVTYVDTAEMYGTEEIVGAALVGRRDGVVLSTKSTMHPRGGPQFDALALREALEASLKKLRTETVDVFHLHAVSAEDYPYCVEALVPELLALRDQGKIRFLALSERFGIEVGHEMLRLATHDDCWDVVMVGFNMLNPSARLDLLPQMIADDIGVEVMFAVRSVFSQPDVLRKSIADAVADGLIARNALDQDDPLDFLIHEAGASSLIEAAYRFARHEPGCHVVLTGTGNIDHLKSNVHSINLGPLPEADLAHLKRLFGHLAIFTGN
jgi:aryl-alcohol dehydrogenase-like predicted oxidoreductase